MNNYLEQQRFCLSDAWQQRFAGIYRLYGRSTVQVLAQAHMVVVGLGGVGSWAAEALARSGIGALTLIDLDEICISNTNRQLHAVQSQLGQSKVNTLCARLKDINPELQLTPIEDFLGLENIAQLITPEHHGVLDAMDMAHTKAALVAYCLARKILIVTTGSAGGKADPSQVTYTDLGRTQYDPLLAKMRRDLICEHGFRQNRRRKYRLDAIFSTERMVYPQSDGSVSETKYGLSTGAGLDCAGSFGSSTMVTGSFGFMAASRLVARHLLRWQRGQVRVRGEPTA